MASPRGFTFRNPAKSRMERNSAVLASISFVLLWRTAISNPYGVLIQQYENKKGRLSLRLPAFFIGVPTGIRTPVCAVRGRRPRPLDDGDLSV